VSRPALEFCFHYPSSYQSRHVSRSSYLVLHPSGLRMPRPDSRCHLPMYSSCHLTPFFLSFSSFCICCQIYPRNCSKRRSPRLIIPDVQPCLQSIKLVLNKYSTLRRSPPFLFTTAIRLVCRRSIRCTFISEGILTWTESTRPPQPAVSGSLPQ
jgi:hypothetical protein